MCTSIVIVITFFTDDSIHCSASSSKIHVNVGVLLLRRIVIIVPIVVNDCLVFLNITFVGVVIVVCDAVKVLDYWIFIIQ